MIGEGGFTGYKRDYGQKMRGQGTGRKHLPRCPLSHSGPWNILGCDVISSVHTEWKNQNRSPENHTFIRNYGAWSDSQVETWPEPCRPETRTGIPAGAAGLGCRGQGRGSGAQVLPQEILFRSSVSFVPYFIFYFYFFCLFRAAPRARHMEIPRLRVLLEL